MKYDLLGFSFFFFFTGVNPTQNKYDSCPNIRRLSGANTGIQTKATNGAKQEEKKQLYCIFLSNARFLYFNREQYVEFEL